jgi:alcohol dehydrogenase (NADP+)
MKMGADRFVVHKGEGKGLKDEVKDLDLIVSTVDVAKGIPISDLLSALTVHGKLISVGLPDDEIPGIMAQDFASNGCFFGTTHIGSKKEVNQMLQLAVDKGVRTWVVPYAMKDCGKVSISQSR